MICVQEQNPCVALLTSSLTRERPLTSRRGGILGVGLLASVAADSDPAQLVSPLLGELERLAVISVRQARRIVVLVLGSSVVLVGVVMLVLPGPGLLVIPLGLAILAAEFQWARLWLKKIRDVVEDAWSR